MSDHHQVPGGFEVTFDFGIAKLVLPRPVAAELRRQKDEAAEQQREKLRAAQETKKQEEAAVPSASGHVVPAEPAPGFHRVLHDFESVVEALGEDQVTTRSADREVRERLLKIGKRLTELGPDRAVGRPVDWEQALQALECQMPNFRAVVQRVRHALLLAAATDTPPRIPPLLLLGPPGVGKTLFSQRLAELMQVPHAAIAFDQPSYGATLRGSDKAWSNTESGLLFNLICLGAAANPVILLDELDKGSTHGAKDSLDPLAQLHGALEPQTARRLQDISVDIEFDASLVTYVGTANDLRPLGMPLISRFEVFTIEPPTRDEAVQVARLVIEQVLVRLKLQDAIRFESRCAYVLAYLSPRLMLRAVELLVAMALGEQRQEVREVDCWSVLGEQSGPRLH